MNQFVISVMSRDRVGIIRDVASQIRRLDGNIADLSQTVLRGYFTMILLATFPDPVTRVAIQQLLATIDAQAGSPLEITVLPANQTEEQQRAILPENIYVLTASGEDRIGFVAAVSTFCADNAINILDLATLVNEEQYVMVLQVDLSRCTSLNTIQRQLQQFSQQTSIRMVLQHNDIFAAIHEINMPS